MQRYTPIPQSRQLELDSFANIALLLMEGLKGTASLVAVRFLSLRVKADLSKMGADSGTRAASAAMDASRTLATLRWLTF